MSDSIKVTVRYKVYKYVLLALLYPAYVFDRLSQFFQAKAEEIRVPAMEAFFATEKGAEIKAKLEVAAKEFVAKLEGMLKAEEATTALPPVSTDEVNE